MSDTLLGQNALFDPLRIQQPDPGQVSLSDAWTANTKALGDEIARQRQISADRGLWGPQGITPAGARDAGMQMAMGTALASTAPADKPPGITVFHGSPHDFDAFDASKIGTGEGAQAYGHGLYFAEGEGVAKSYRDKLETPTFDAPNLSAPARAWLDNTVAGNPIATTADIGQAARNSSKYYGADHPIGQAAAEVAQGVKAGDVARVPSGRMYEVNIAADPQHFLDWDKPLSEQHPLVQQALGDLGVDIPSPAYKVRPVDGGHVVDYTHDGSNWSASSRVFKTAEEATRQADITMQMMDRPTGAAVIKRDPGVESKLRDAGIPGIRYLDAGSRGAGSGTSNYVVFDPKMLSIVRKYAVPAFATAGGIPAAMGGSQPQQ
jgi:hypothetical protein